MAFIEGHFDHFQGNKPCFAGLFDRIFGAFDIVWAIMWP